jgi:hypothetical protein
LRPLVKMRLPVTRNFDATLGGVFDPTRRHW